MSTPAIARESEKDKSPGDLDLISRRIRGKLVEMSHRAGTPHLGSAMSCVDILVAAYFERYCARPLHLTDGAAYLGLVVTGVPAILAVSYLFYLVFERPFLSAREKDLVLGDTCAAFYGIGKST